MVLIISHRKNLRQRYGDGGVVSIADELTKLKNAMEKHGIPADTVFVDEETKIGEFQWSAIQDNEPKIMVDKIQDQLRDYYFYCRNASEVVSNPLTDLLIVGGDDIIPFCKYWYRPSIQYREDEDREIYSDAPYGSSRKDRPNFAWAVGRLPDGDPPNKDLLLKEITTAKNAHSAASVSGNASTAIWCTMEMCRSISESILHNIRSRLSAADNMEFPPRLPLRPQEISGKLIHYYNLHGSKNAPEWNGDDGRQQVRALELQTLNSAPQVDGSIVVSSACYGAHVIGKHSGNSMALKFLESGIKCFVGSTVASYGSSPPKGNGAVQLEAGDLIANKFLELVAGGERFGEALRLAKNQYLKTVFSSRRDFDRFDFKTLTEFVLYGDPTLRWKNMETLR